MVYILLLLIFDLEVYNNKLFYKKIKKIYKFFKNE